MNFLSSLEKLPDVVSLWETFLKEQSTISIPGYSILRKDGEYGCGGVAFLIRKEIFYIDFQVLKDVEGIAVKIRTVSGNLEIANVYSSTTNLITTFLNLFF